MTMPPGADAPSSVRLDARSLRGLAHPLRVRLLGLLREHGPATATGLAAQVGESSGVTSYHLRQLAAHGFIVEDEAPRRSRRERWWRAAHRMTVLEPLPEPDPGTDVLVDEYVRAVASSYADRIQRFADGLATSREVLGAAWSNSADLSDWWLELTPEQAVEIGREFESLLEGYPRADPERPLADGTERIVVQLQVMPTITRSTVVP